MIFTCVILTLTIENLELLYTSSGCSNMIFFRFFFILKLVCLVPNNVKTLGEFIQICALSEQVLLALFYSVHPKCPCMEVCGEWVGVVYVWVPLTDTHL